MSRPAICPACGRVHHERVPLACLACMVSDVEDTEFTSESPDEEGNRITYDMLYGDEDESDTQPMPALFDEEESTP